MAMSPNDRPKKKTLTPMQGLVGLIRESLPLRPPRRDEVGGGGGGGGFGGLVGKVRSSLRNSRIGLLPKAPVCALPPVASRDDAPPIRWRKGELIGSGAFGRVYMGMNLDSGELLAVKQVLIAANSASKEKTQAHIRELEEEVKLLKNLSHPNIVRYLGTAREEDSLNILLEFVPGGSISSLLGKFGSFPESVIRMYTKQLLLGLEYLHKNEIMHRDIKGANILVDNKGCIKLADFGASKKVVELATINGAKSMKGTPYWMAPEVILQTGHSFLVCAFSLGLVLLRNTLLEVFYFSCAYINQIRFTDVDILYTVCLHKKCSADIWSVGCTVIEMATGKPPWSQQYQEVAVLFHIGTTKSHPPIPEHLSAEAKDFLLKCLEKEPCRRSSASELVQHPFVIGDYQEPRPVLRASFMFYQEAGNEMAAPGTDLKNFPSIRRSTCAGLKDICDIGSVRCSTVYPGNFSGGSSRWGPSSNDDDDMCQIDDTDDIVLGSFAKFRSVVGPDELNKSFNPMCEPNDDWPCKFDENLETERSGINFSPCQTIHEASGSIGASQKVETEFMFPSGPSAAEDDEEVTESKIRAFLDEKALDLKKLQTPLYEEFCSSLNAAGIGNANREHVSKHLNLPPKSKSPSRAPSRRFSTAFDAAGPGKHTRDVSNASGVHDRVLQEIQPPQLSEWKELPHDQKESFSLSASFSEMQRKWKQELDEELERKREMMWQAGAGTNTPSPNKILSRQRERLGMVFPGK
ncbi:mitogen-activated protein kinase kinase kinase NPK1-like isoform X1 [Malus sylvestris]|uniref:mitogen-activated protein kinase kinase kinase NPK1-like isoform X1 n=1 Tax=Malus sylvestris TaxID=3752 RepID=UPI0021ACA742|nr:mitogen-activated protein kinase kinase kinase NPK1-like isoform X1 [Malus sylvestris]